MTGETPIDLDDIDSGASDKESRETCRAAGDGMVFVRKGIIRQSNEAMALLSGYRHEEVLDTVFASFFHLDDIPLVESLCCSQCCPEDREQKPVVRLIGKNGDAIPVEISVGAGDDRRPTGHHIVIRHLHCGFPA